MEYSEEHKQRRIAATMARMAAILENRWELLEQIERCERASEELERTMQKLSEGDDGIS